METTKVKILDVYAEEDKKYIGTVATVLRKMKNGGFEVEFEDGKTYFIQKNFIEVLE